MQEADRVTAWVPPLWVRIGEDMARTAQAALDKPAATLTGEEQTALAWMAGCPMGAEVEGHTVRVSTLVPVGFRDGPGGVVVVIRAETR